jgi:hypothetical protein
MKVKMPVKPEEKIIAFVALLALFVLVAWPDLDRRLVWRLFITFAAGAGLALWAGRERISIFKPTTLASWWILLGSGWALWAFVMVLFVRFR